LLISTLEIESSKFLIRFELNRQDSIRFLESNSISRIDAISLDEIAQVERCYNTLILRIKIQKKEAIVMSISNN
jgi:hypothetical protein